jgi:hypothetical protein
MLRYSAMPLTRIMKRIGPRIEPCLTQYRTLIMELVVPSQTTHCRGSPVGGWSPPQRGQKLPNDLNVWPVQWDSKPEEVVHSDRDLSMAPM